MKRLAVFASGNGSNAEAIVHHLANTRHEVGLVVSNNPKAGVLERSKRLGIECLLTKKVNGSLSSALLNKGIDAIALAGYLKLIPASLLASYTDRIWNIHPALLPAYGGQGMYGDRIHRKVIKDGVNRTGITIHAVNEQYDEGKILFQASLPVEKDWNLKKLTHRIHRLEHMYYPEILELLLDELEQIKE